MIKNIAENIPEITTYLEALPTLSALVPWWVWFESPSDLKSITWNFIYISIVSDITKSNTNEWYLLKKARLSFHIVWASQITLPKELYHIAWTIANLICDEKCKKMSLTWIRLAWVSETWYISPLLEVEQRPYIVKDFFFTYFSI